MPARFAPVGVPVFSLAEDVDVDEFHRVFASWADAGHVGRHWLVLLVVVDIRVDVEAASVAFLPAWRGAGGDGLAAGESLCVSGGVSGDVFLVQNGCPFIWGGVQSVMVSMVSIGVMMSAWIFPASHVR